MLEVHGNSRKLKRGALIGNRFRIRLRKAAWSREQLELKLAAVRAHGVPNYFGPQRFGRDGYNLDRVQAWVLSGQAPRGRTERGFALSAARSLIFNAVLARRKHETQASVIAIEELSVVVSEKLNCKPFFSVPNWRLSPSLIELAMVVVVPVELMLP